MILHHEVDFTLAHPAQKLAVQTGNLELRLQHCGLLLVVQLALEYFFVFLFQCYFCFLLILLVVLSHFSQVFNRSLFLNLFIYFFSTVFVRVMGVPRT